MKHKANFDYRITTDKYYKKNLFESRHNFINDRS